MINYHFICFPTWIQCRSCLHCFHCLLQIYNQNKSWCIRYSHFNGISQFLMSLVHLPSLLISRSLLRNWGLFKEIQEGKKSSKIISDLWMKRSVCMCVEEGRLAILEGRQSYAKNLGWDDIWCPTVEPLSLIRVCLWL